MIYVHGIRRKTSTITHGFDSFKNYEYKRCKLQVIVILLYSLDNNPNNESIPLHKSNL